MNSLHEEDNRELLRQVLIELRKQNELLAANQSNGIKHKHFYDLEGASVKLAVSADTLQYLTRPNNVLPSKERIN